MRLQYIKLAGFKSFVDATKVPFPDQMTCVVGPNGCGKSNVIDAVRWVLGESSAKNLRGDAMTDVIFNGSTARKPVSRASVELVFDNSSARLQGEFASYSDISVKRVVTRDGQSTYYLNGNKCRRRDITDLFLGTGLGPRSYAIIEQGMISRLIESKPQELRVFIEEAAGISKYKERRKETESRMRKTRENLERLTDVRDELATQLAKLERQAAAAKRYKTLKAEERTYKAQLQTLKWSQYQHQCDRIEAQLRDQETELQRWIAEQRGSERGQTELREQQQDLKTQLDTAQQQFYQCNSEITRIEQSIQHQRQLAEQRRRNIDELQSQRRQLLQEVEDEQLELVELQQTQVSLAPDVELQQARVDELAATIADLQERKATTAQQHQQYLHGIQQREQALAVLKTQLAGIDGVVAELTQRAAAYQDKLAALEDVPTAARHQAQAELVEQYEVDEKAAADDHRAATAELEELLQRFQEAQTKVQDLQAQQHYCQQQMQSYTQLLASLEQQQDAELAAWLENRRWRPLRELLTVDSDWQLAVEVVAGPWLNAPVLLATPGEAARSAPGRSGQLLAIPDAPEALKTGKLQPLSHAIQGPAATLAMFQQAVCVNSANDLDEAFADSRCVLAVDRQGRLYTRDGWRQNAEDQAQVLVWQQALAQFSDQLPEITAALEQAREALAGAETRYAAAKVALTHAQQASVQRASELAHAKAELHALARQHHDEQARRAELKHQIDQLHARQANEQATQQELMAEQQRVQEDLAVESPAQQQLRQTLNEIDRDLTSLQSQHQHAHQQQHQLALQLQHVEQNIEHMQKSKGRAQQRLTQLDERLAELVNTAPDADADIELEQAELEEALIRQSDAEQTRYRLGQALAEVESQLDSLNQGQQGVQQRIDAQRSQIEASKMELTAARERGHTLIEGLEETGYSLKHVLETLPSDANEHDWQRQLDKIGRSLQQLGAINLAAIEEAEAQGERKAYLDAQHNDLSDSLTLLEEAIKKIDRETRQRFRKTFDQVNHDLGQLFPKVFGGGSAYLALTDDDLLETGVTIMAKPPGKKNSTIHLLSGGEKALTALSLVFAIFRLNPAPFCMLDEVDAPLDDANVGRFCRLVQEMSATVQFIYISHNKIAMEMATHLAGVTMQEPGVSRLVSVDVDEAVEMAEAS